MRFLEFIACLMAFWSIMLTVTFRLEKRMVWPFGELEAGPQINDPNRYAVGERPAHPCEAVIPFLPNLSNAKVSPERSRRGGRDPHVPPVRETRVEGSRA